MVESTNSFNGGLNRDFNKVTQPKNSYIDANNIRLTTYEGSNNVTLSNVLGTTGLSSIPNTSPVIKLLFNTSPPSSSQPYTINIDGMILSGTMLITMANIANVINTQSTYVGYHAYVSPDGDYIYLIDTLSGNIISFIVTYGAPPTTITGVVYIVAQISLFPIGAVNIRDEIFIITTNETSKVPALSGGIGQIWKLTYNKITLSPTYTLLYNNYLNLTSYHPVPPTAIQGRYENTNTKRIYWTDNFNKLRSFNTSATNAFALPPEVINVELPINPTIPILKVIPAGGKLTGGMYQSCYRLKNTKATTFFSDVSNLVEICASTVAESAATGGAAGGLYISELSTTNCNKSITWTIKDLDINFERIEIVILYFDTLNGSPTIVLTHDEPIPKSGTFQFTYTGAEEIAKMTTAEFLNQSFAFTHCKSLTIKDNQLIAANVRNTKIDFTYDARAYRYKIAQPTFDLNDSSGNTTTFTNYSDVVETHDAINPNVDLYAYKANSGILGGTGSLVNYEFGTYSVKGDDLIQLSASQNSQFSHTNPSYTTGTWNFGVTNQDYPQNNINDGCKFAYLAGIMKGYQRCEIYRFGIIFYDKLNRPLFVRWIGDIKMPEYSQTNSNPDAIATTAGVTDFRTSFVSGSSCYVQNLYVKFNVNVPPSIRSLISGFRIVRTERTQSDKTVLGAGLVTQMVSDGAQLYPPSQYDNDTTTPDMNLSGETGAAGNSRQYNYTFDSPDFLMGSFPGKITNDKLSIVEVLGKATAQSVVDILPPNEAGGDPYRIVKYYNTISTYPIASGTTNSKTIDEASTIGYGNNSFTFSSNGPSATWVYNNYNHSASLGSRSNSVGTNTLVIGLATGQNLAIAATYGTLNNSYKRAYALYYRPTVSQYGGNTYSARSRNNYMACGSFQPLTTTNLAQQNFTQSVLGGDIFLDIYDNQRLIKNYGTVVTGRSSAGVTKENFAMFWACESTFNTGLRSGVHINKDLGINSGQNGYGSGASIYETYSYNTIYNQENNFLTYIPKPLNFIALEEYDSRIWVSEQKENGEDTDSWGIFLPAKYYDADGNYGAINAVLTFKDKIYFFQDDACGIVPISDRALIQTSQSEQLTTGSPADIIQRPQYLSKTIGSKHQWSITSSKNGIYFFDIKSVIPYKCDGESIKEIDGMYSYLVKELAGQIRYIDNPVYNDTTLLRNGIIAVSDNLTDDIYFTFHNAQPTVNNNVYTQFSKTLSFNESLGKWVSFLDFTPSLYIATKESLISPNPANKRQLHLHNTGTYCNFYNTFYPTKVSVLVNDHPKNTKIFTNLEWESESLDVTTYTNQVDQLTDTWTTIRARNSYQNTDTIFLTNKTNVKRKERSWRYAIPRNILVTTGTNFDILDPANFNQARLYKEFLRDKWCIVDLTYVNAFNRRFSSPFLTTKYLISPR